MTRLSKALSPISWKYAAGELFLISVGVFIALAASDWQTRLEDRRTELAMLQEIRSALTSDLVSLESGLERFQRIEMAAVSLLDHLEGGRAYDKSLDALDYPIIVSVMTLERNNVLGLLRPYFLASFRDLTFGVSATPINYEEIIGDTDFVNIIGYRLQVARQTDIPVFAQSVTNIMKLVAAIDSEITE